MSNVVEEVGVEVGKSSKAWIFWSAAALALLVYLFVTREKFDETNLVDPESYGTCLNYRGLNKQSAEDFEKECEGKSFVATVYEEGCYASSSCELSLYDPMLPGFNRDTLFEADLVKSISVVDDALRVKGVISGRGFLGQVEVNVYEQEVVALTGAEEAAREEARKPKIDPMIEAERRLFDERQAENQRMMQYAEMNGKELSAKSTQVKVDPDSVNGMAEYRYYLKSGKVISCLRGFSADVFVYECEEHRFN